ncbi:hypothetical protein [Kibdelosporangium phytohabitans]|uniref:Uncharacterized protein n=1 Tax=Kibdelosporangium phytohabitans TaxID=860235 RepID=A0A0N9HRW7_9PSEU|nr:hypothetical protein [Kibdelosporangium phytohabitans]ALG07644.1 hypothetical protein AOZ06_12655 [Kibdelosporangium phytohabitans]ALG07700.1 hypothetical protein AOZ06_12975 [Kibdelosporangium phytohabitans]MBE1471402.1 hypothetical protein [Kibdelosporangium phytohabitans]
MTITEEPEVRDVHGDPETTHEYQEDDWDQEWPPESTTVGWDLSWGCRANFTRATDGDYTVTVNTFGADQRNGITNRRFDREQLVDFARQLLALADEENTRA